MQYMEKSKCDTPSLWNCHIRNHLLPKDLEAVVLRNLEITKFKFHYENVMKVWGKLIEERENFILWSYVFQNVGQKRTAYRILLIWDFKFWNLMWSLESWKFS